MNFEEHRHKNLTRNQVNVSGKECLCVSTLDLPKIRPEGKKVSKTKPCEGSQKKKHT
jgi:hypothetical protein